MLDLQIVIVDTIDRKAQLCWLGCLAPHLPWERGLGGEVRLLAHNPLQTFNGGLDGTLVDIWPNPAAAEFLSNGSSCARAEETIEDNITQIRCQIYDAFH